MAISGKIEIISNFCLSHTCDNLSLSVTICQLLIVWLGALSSGQFLYLLHLVARRLLFFLLFFTTYLTICYYSSHYLSHLVSHHLVARRLPPWNVKSAKHRQSEVDAHQNHLSQGFSYFTDFTDGYYLWKFRWNKKSKAHQRITCAKDLLIWHKPGLRKSTTASLSKLKSWYHLSVHKELRSI